MKTKKNFAFLFVALSIHITLTAQNPQFKWANKMGGPNYDWGEAIAVDWQSNVYTTGYFETAANFDPAASNFSVSCNGGIDIFISKNDSLGNFLWVKAIGGSGDETGEAIVVDLSGNVYVTGYFHGTVDFDPGPGTYTLNTANKSAFVLKLSAAGNFLWAAGIDHANSNGLTVDPTGAVYLAGDFSGIADFDPGINTHNLTAVGPNDAFICKFDGAGNFVWANQVTGSWGESNKAIVLDALGNAYVSGDLNTSNSVDFDPGPAVANLGVSSGMYIAKYDYTGNFAWVKLSGNMYNCIPYVMTIDALGNIYTVGNFSGTGDFDPGAGNYMLTSASGQFTDIFISKLDAGGNFLWAKNIAGSSYKGARSIAMDAAGNALITGFFWMSADFDPGIATHSLTAVNYGDMYILKLDQGGNFVWVKQFGGPDDEEGHGIITDVTGNIYATGYFSGTPDLNPGAGIYTLTSSGHDDISIIKLYDCDVPPALVDAVPANDFICIGQSASLSVIYNYGAISWFANATSTTVLSMGSYYLTPQLTGNATYYAELHTCATSPRTAITVSVGTCLGIKKTALITNAARLYPNPFNSSAIFEIDELLINAELCIYNAVGQKVNAIQLSGTKTTFQRGSLKQGIYFYELRQGLETVATGKFIIND